MTLRVGTLVLLLLLTLSAVWACVPQWESEVPLSIHGLWIGMNVKELKQLKGEPSRRLDAELALYDRDQLVVRVREDLVVYVAGSELAQAGTTFALSGCTAEEVEQQWGKASVVLHKQTLQARIFHSKTADLGLLLENGRVAGYLLNEPGTMQGTLEAAGYRRLP